WWRTSAPEAQRSGPARVGDRRTGTFEGEPSCSAWTRFPSAPPRA
ncbi:MAG: hypothetical protein AVDCRST_MAG66-2277, partial [uncultured Pseudonocardia sp.]